MWPWSCKACILRTIIDPQTECLFEVAAINLPRVLLGPLQSISALAKPKIAVHLPSFLFFFFYYNQGPLQSMITALAEPKVNGGLFGGHAAIMGVYVHQPVLRVLVNNHSHMGVSRRVRGRRVECVKNKSIEL